MPWDRIRPSSLEPATLYPAVSSLAAVGGRRYLADTQSLVAAMTVAPNIELLDKIDIFISRARQIGVWDKLAAFYYFPVHDRQASRLNWKNPSSYQLTEINAPEWVAYRGFNPGASNQGHLDTGFPIFSAVRSGIEVGCTDLLFGSVINYTTTQGGAAVGTSSGYSQVSLNRTTGAAPNWAVTRFVTAARTSTFVMSSNIDYFFVMNRSDPNSYDVYTQFAQETYVNCTLGLGADATTLLMLRFNTFNVADGANIKSGFFGKSLTPSEITSFQGAILELIQNTDGVPV